MMLPQRACGAENQAENKSSNGPLRVYFKGLLPEYDTTWRHTSVAGDMTVSCKACGFSANQGGTADKKLFVLDRII